MSLSSIFDPFTNQAQMQAANAQIAGINAGIGQANNYFGQGANALNNNFGSAISAWGPQQQFGNSAFTQLGNALGMNGASGNSAALQGFQNNPGYQFQLQQGENAVLANQAATGQLNSGNTDIALNNYAQGQANQSWNQYLGNLQNAAGFGNSANQGISSAYQGLGTNLANLYGQQAQASYGAQTSIGNANANAALGNLTGASNLWGAIGGLASLGTGGGATLGGNFLKGLIPASDERVKDDIEPVGELYDGQPVYRYRYKGDPRHQIGLLAQDVERHTPEAVAVIHPSGMKGVDYRRATDRAAGFAERMQRFLDAAR
jgi:hypothetical protein